MTANGSRRYDFSERYDVVETVRRSNGAMLLRAVRRDDGRRVLLKVLLRSGASEVAQFRNELALASTPGLLYVVRPLALDTVEGLPALVREDVDGEPLDRMLGAPMK